MPGRKKLPVHPSRAAGPLLKPPCEKCTALCCRYFTVPLARPRSHADFDEIKWFLVHEDTWVWSDGRSWYLQVERVCRHLGDDDRCRIYRARPQVCRDYGTPEARAKPEDPLCDYFSDGSRHPIELRQASEVDALAGPYLQAASRERAKRSAAAKKAWKTRRHGGRRVTSRW